MAKQTLWQRIKGWFSGGNKGGNTKKSSSSSSSSRYSNNRPSYTRMGGGGGGVNRRELVNRLNSGGNGRPTYKSMAEATSSPKDKGLAAAIDEKTNTAKYFDRQNGVKKEPPAPSSASKNTVPDPKRAAAKASSERAKQTLENLKKERAELNAATNNRYNTKQSDKKEAQLARQRIKSGDMAADPTVAKVEFEQHPVASLAGRKFAQGMSFGLADLAEQKLAGDRYKESIDLYKKAEEEHPWVAGLSELAGGFVSFGGTAGATERLGAKAVSKVAPRAAERLAEKKVVQSLAKRGVNKAVKKGLVGEATEELIKQTGKEKAAKIVSALGNDIVQNLTTGAIYDINKASAQHEVGSKDWWKELGTSAALNFAVTGGVAGGSILGGNKKAAIEAAGKLAKDNGIGEEAAKKVLRSNLTVKGKAKPLVRNADEAVETTAKNADEVGAIEKRLRDIDTEMDYIEKGSDWNAYSNPRYKELQAEKDELSQQLKEFQAENLKITDDVAEDIPFTNDKGEPITGEIKTTQKRGIHRGQNDNFATVGDDIPTDDLKGLRANDTRAELEDRVEMLGEQKPNPNADEPLKVNKVAPDEPIAKDLPSGVKQVRSAYEYNNGEKIEGGTLTKWKEAWNASKEYSKSHATGDKVRQSKVAVTQLNAMDSEAERALREQLVASGDLNYEAISTPELYDKVAKQLRDDADHYIKEMIDINEGGALDFRSTPEWQARVQYILGTVDPSADEASEIAYTEAFKLAQNISSKGGQVLNLRKNFVHLTPLGKRDAILDDFINLLDKSKGFRKNHPELNKLGKFDQRNYIRAFLMEDEGIMNGVQKVVEADSLDDVSEAFAELMLNVNKNNPKTAFDVIQELRYLNMLGNPKTHIRNMFGSGFFAPMRQVSNAIRAGIEDSIAKGAGLEVTKHGGISPMAAKEAWAKNPTTEAGKAALEAFERRKKDILGSMKYEAPQYAGRGKTVAGKAIDKLSDFNSNLLAKEDDFFKSRAFKENYIKSYNKYLKDGVPITDKIKNQIEQEAMQEAQIATFNEYNEFAKWLSNITRKTNDANASTLARWGARGVNAVMPFTKVPANLMKQSINYSPIGIAKGMLSIKQAAKKGDAVLLNKAIDELASGLTGTGVFGLGMLLGKTTDMFTTNTGKNDPAAKFKKDRGMQNYSITFKDPETGQGHSFTLDWLVPMSATFFSGVEMANQLKRGDFNILDIGNDWSTVMTRLAEPVMETSMLSGLHGMLETMRSGSDSDDTKSAIQVLLRETAQSYMSSMIPTVLGQASRTAYKSDMQITGEDDWEYFWNQTKSKAGLANTNILGEALGADTDAYGNIKGEKNSTSDYVKSGLKNFLSPANIQKVDFSEVDNEKLRVYEDAVKNGADPNDMAYLFPKKQYKKQFSVAGEDVKMSNKDLSTYNQAKTKGGEEGMRYILENIMFNRYDYDSMGKKVPTAGAYTKAEKQALMEQFKGKSMREVEEWLYQQPEFKNASKAEQKKAISGLWGLSKDTKAVASQRVGEQAVYKAQGKDVNEYNYKNEITESKRDQLQPYIDSGLLTYEEAVDFARNGGKVSYTEDEDGGGSATTYYSKASMIDYFVEHGIPYDKAEALYNAFKAKNAKPYSGNNKSSGRSGYGGRRRYRSGGGGKSKVPTINAKSMAAATKSSKGTKVKLEPPTPKTTPKVTTKFRKYDI